MTNTERGFGTGLRAKLSSNGNEPVAQPPRSPGEAIKAATPSNGTDLEALRAELISSLARELDLRASLGGQHHDASLADALAQHLAERKAELDHRASALSATAAALGEAQQEG